MPGWKHTWDLLIRRGLSSLVWWPHFLEQLKSIVYILRNKSHVKVLAGELRKLNLPAVAEMLLRSKFPSFAHWRWETLEDCVGSLARVLQTLKQHFNAAWLRNSREGVHVRLMATALSSAQWLWQFTFVHWYCSWLGHIMRWGTGCSCHEQALNAGEAVDCEKKGRRIKEAYGFACAELDKGLTEANAWTADLFNCGDHELAVLQGCVRGIFHLSHLKINFLDSIPWLLARLNEPDISRRCIRQWQSVDRRHHDNASAYVLEEGCQLRQDVEAIAADGSGLSVALQKEVRKKNIY